MNILLEYIVVFILVLILNSFMYKVNNKQLKKDKKNKRTKKVNDELSIELLYLKKLYKIDLNKLDKAKLQKICLIVNSFIISTIYIILIYLLEGWVLRIIFGIVLLMLMIIICYGVIGRYYNKKEGE